MVCVSTLSAELVATRLDSFQNGHAWIFGSSVNRSCWVAAPAHVFKSSNGQLQKGILSLSGGKEYQLAEKPIQPDPDIDLAFAPVNIQYHQCRYRLGIDDLTHSISTAEEVKLTIISSTYKEGILARVRDLGIDGTEMSLKPVSVQDHFQKGYSGGLISIPRDDLGSEDLPIGLLLRVCDPNSVDQTLNAVNDFSEDAPQNPCDGVNHYGIALRFDKIKKLFYRYQTKIIERDSKDHHRRNERPIKLVSTSGHTIGAQSGPDNSFSKKDRDDTLCWRVSSDKYKKVGAEILIVGDPIRRIKVYSCSISGDDSPVGMGVQFKVSESDPWSSIRYCRSRPQSEVLVDCNFSPRASAYSYLLEFKTPKKGLPVSIGRVVVE